MGLQKIFRQLEQRFYRYSQHLQGDILNRTIVGRDGNLLKVVEGDLSSAVPIPRMCQCVDIFHNKLSKVRDRLAFVAQFLNLSGRN